MKKAKKYKTYDCPLSKNFKSKKIGEDSEGNNIYNSRVPASFCKNNCGSYMKGCPLFT